jgi:hypothetical protein
MRQLQQVGTVSSCFVLLVKYAALLSLPYLSCIAEIAAVPPAINCCNICKIAAVFLAKIAAISAFLKGVLTKRAPGQAVGSTAHFPGTAANGTHAHVQDAHATSEHASGDCNLQQEFLPPPETRRENLKRFVTQG